MSNTTTSPAATAAPSGAPAWRTVDLVVASALGVAFGAVFYGWNTLWSATDGAFKAFPPAQGFMYGVWLLPGVLGMLVVRKPGAAIYTELVASIVSAILPSPWGLQVVVYGLIEGAGPELVFAFLLYRSFRLPVALAAGAAAGLAASLLDLTLYYADWSGSWQTTYAVLLAVSSAVIAGLGGWALTRALARSGVLAPFASGRDQKLV